MPEGVVQASLPRRALAYVIDLLILALPLGAGSALLASHGFDQAIKPGIAGLCTLALISGVYSASVCTTLARSGQSLGKKLLGLRVLSADTGRSAPLNATILRSSAFVGGLLLIGAGPLITAVQLARKSDDEQTWQHKLGGTTLLDIRRGTDPLNLVPKHYARYPEQWLSGTETAVVTRYPPPAEPWSTAYPTSTPAASAPSTQPPRPEADETRPPPPAVRRPSWIQPSIQVAGTITALGLLTSAAGWGVGLLQPSPRIPDPTQFHATTLARITPSLTASPSRGFPGYRNGPVWNRQLAPGATTTSVNSGTFVFDNRTLTVVDNATGKVLSKQQLSGEVAFTQETLISGESGLAWQIGETLYAWTPSLGGKPALSMALPATAKVSAAGTDLLIQSGDGSLYTISGHGLLPLAAPDGLFPRAVDDGKLISTRNSGSLIITSPEGNDRRDIPLNPPKDNLQLVDWVTTGHGVATLLWSPLPDSKDPQNTITIAVYRLNTGELLSSMDVPRSRIDADPVWVRGQGFRWAGYAGYAYSLSSGTPVLDLEAQKIKRLGLIGAGVLGERAEGTVYLNQETATLSSEITNSRITSIALVQDGVVLTTKNRELQRFTAE